MGHREDALRASATGSPTVERSTADIVGGERSRVAHELHDGPVQTVVSAVLELEALQVRLREGAEAPWAVTSVEQTKATAQRAVDELRAIVRELSKPVRTGTEHERSIREATS